MFYLMFYTQCVLKTHSFQISNSSELVAVQHNILKLSGVGDQRVFKFSIQNMWNIFGNLDINCQKKKIKPKDIKDINYYFHH